jgi:hypothetical protein
VIQVARWRTDTTKKPLRLPVDPFASLAVSDQDGCWFRVVTD